MAAYRPKTTDNVGTLWRSSHVFGAAWLAVIEGRYRKQPSDTMDSAKHIPLFHFLDFADFNAHLPERCELIGVECVVGARMLPGYHHPERAVYLFGPEDGSIPLVTLRINTSVRDIPFLLAYPFRAAYYRLRLRYWVWSIHRLYRRVT